jgi:hypothetical protein
MYYDGTNYHMDSYTEVLPTLTQNVAIDKTFAVQSFTASEQLELTGIKQSIEDLEDVVAQLQEGTGMTLYDNVNQANSAGIPNKKVALIKI